MKEYKSLRKGVSLIVLVVTIVVLLILVSVTILSVKDQDTVSKAKEAVFREDILNFQTEFNSYIDDKKFEAISLGQYYSPQNDSELDEVRDYEKLKKIMPSFSEKYSEQYSEQYEKWKRKFIIQNGELVYTGEDTTKEVTDVLDDLNVKIHY